MTKEHSFWLAPSIRRPPSITFRAAGMAFALFLVSACTSGRVIEITANDQMQYSTNIFEAKAGEKVILELRHIGTMPKATMGHNLVILNEGTDVDAFAAAAIEAGEARGYIPDEFRSEIVVQTKLIGGGESTKIEFIAPPPGKYPFVCSFPGHAASMRGEFVVSRA